MNFETLKPAVSKQTHFLLTAVVWSGVGVMLITKGFYRYPEMSVSTLVMLLFFAILAGSIKSLFLLDTAAKSGLFRIEQFAGPVFLGALYPPKTWLMMVAMIAMGVALKYSPLPTILLCFVYFTVGWALLLSSRHAWLAWQLSRRNSK